MNNVLWIVEQLLDEVRANNPDRRLLERFARDRDEGAFAELVRRHGPMVLGVCRRVLGNDADADDAFQSVFLVLARKAAAVGDPDQLSQWLHGVAYNASRKLRQANARRTAREHAAAVPADVPAPDLDLAGEWLAALDEELTRLPTNYRAVVVLCDLEGRTRKEAASELGWPEGTVAGRLARARERLANLLRARGYAPVVGVTVAAPVLSSATVAAVARAVAVYGLAGAAGGLISPRAQLTAQGVIQAMVAKKLQTLAAGLCVGLALLAAVGGIHNANAQPGPGKPDPVEKPWVPDRPRPAEEKVLSVIPLKKLDAKPTADKLLELLPKSVTVAAARDENALLVYATARGTDDVRLVLRTLGEDTPKPGTGAAVWDFDRVQPGRVFEIPNAFPRDSVRPSHVPITPFSPDSMKPRWVIPRTFNFSLSASWDQVFETYARLSGLEYKGTIKIDGKFTFDNPPEVQFTFDQFTDAINHELLRKKLLLVRGPKTFTVVRPEDVDARSLPQPDLVDLNTFADTALVQVLFPLDRTKVDDFVWLAKLVGTPFVTAEAKQNGVVVRDIASKVRALVKHARESGALGKIPEPVKTYSISFEKTPWKDVFAWYEQASGLKRKGNELPTGTFTLNRPGPNPGEKLAPLFTLAEVSDAINDALFAIKDQFVQHKWLLIHGDGHFRVHPADEVVPDEYFRRVPLTDIRARGRYELLEVEIAIPADDKTGADEIRAGFQHLMSRFGKVVVTKDRRLILRDTAGKLQRVIVEKPTPTGGMPGGIGTGSPPPERPRGGGAPSAPLTPRERVQLTLHELGELKRDLTKWKGKALTGYVLDYPLARIEQAEDALGPVLLEGKAATGAGKPPRSPRAALAMDELAVLKQEMNAQKGKKLEGDVLARLLARIEATEKLLESAADAGAPGTGSPGPVELPGGPGAMPGGGADKKVEHTGTLTGVVLTQSATDKTQRVESAAVRVKDQVFQLDVSESLAARQELIRLYGGDPVRSTAVADPQVTVKGRLEYRFATTLKKGEREAALVPVIVVESLQVNNRPLGIPGGGGPGALPPGAMPGLGAPGATGTPRGAMPAGGGAGIGAPPRPRTQEERERDQAIEERTAGLVKSLGGSVQRDERLPGKPVVQVHLYRGKVTDDNLKMLAAFTNLRELTLMDTPITDAGMKHVATMANLQSLNLQGTKVTDEGLKHLRPLKKLSEIDLTRTAVTDAGVKHLLAHAGLTHLYLWGTEVTDAGVKDLVKLTDLKRLELGGSKVTDAGVKELASLKALTVLGLQLTGVTDKGMKSLAPLAKLTRLDLHNTAITDAGLKDLATLPALADLRVAGCKLSADGIAAFKKAKPECAIEADTPKKSGPAGSEPLTPHEAGQQPDGTEATVRFQIPKDFQTGDEGTAHLFDYLSSDQWTGTTRIGFRVVLSEQARGELKRNGITDLSAHFRGRTVTVLGKIASVLKLGPGIEQGTLTIESSEQLVTVK